MERPSSNNEEPAGPQEAGSQYITRAEALAMAENILNQVRTYTDRGRARSEAAIKALAEEVQAICNIRPTSHKPII